MSKRVPKETAYIRVFNNLKEDIISNYNYGDVLPTEPELEKQYNVSRITIRKAIKILFDEGYVHTHQGRGTFVTDPNTVQRINYITSVSETLQNEGYVVKATNVHVDEFIPNNDILKLLNLSKGTSVSRIQRILNADGYPIAIATNYIALRLPLEELEQHEELGFLYQLIENHYNTSLDNATDFITARSANIMQSQVLKIPVNSPLIYVRRIIYTKGSPLMCDDLFIDASRYKLSVNLVGRTNGMQ